MDTVRENRGLIFKKFEAMFWMKITSEEEMRNSDDFAFKDQSEAYRAHTKSVVNYILLYFKFLFDKDSADDAPLR